MKFLALDQALKTSGWALFEEDKLLEKGTFKISPTLPIEERLGLVGENIEELFQSTKFEHLYFENIQFQSNQQTYKTLAYVQASVLLWCGRHKMPYTIFSPTEWRAIMVQHGVIDGFGKGRTQQKQKAQQFVKDKYQCDVTQDEADAICLGLAGWLKRPQNFV